MSTPERDEKSIKCSECGGFVMMSNSISWKDVDGQCRPISSYNEHVILSGTCIICHTKVPLKGILVVSKETRTKSILCVGEEK